MRFAQSGWADGQNPKIFEKSFTNSFITFERFEINGLLKALRKALFKARRMRYHTGLFEGVENFRNFLKKKRSD